MDLSKLSDEEFALAEKLAKWSKREITLDQFDNAKKVQEKSIKMGLNPDFVLAMVMQESGFKSDAKSGKGAFGVMQLMPETAKSLKVDPTNIDENIDGGLRLLKELIANPKIGNDPYKVLAGYNASTETRNKFYETGDLAVLPDETIDYMEKVSDYYGGSLPNVAGGLKEDGEKESVDNVELPNPPNMGGGKPLRSADATNSTAPSPEFSPILGAGVGAASGAATGSAAAIAQAKFDALRAGYDKFNQMLNPAAQNVESASDAIKPVTDVSKPSGTSAIVEDQTPGGKWGKKTGYGVGEGSTKEVSTKYQRLMPQGKVSKRTAKLYGPQLPGENPQLSQRLIDKFKKAEADELAERANKVRKAQQALQAKDAIQSAAAEKAMIAREAAELEKTVPPSRFAKMLPYINKFLSYPLKGAAVGAGAGFSAVDAYNRYNQKDNTGAAISGLGGLAGLASTMIPSAGALPALSVAAPLYLTASDRIKRLQQHPEEFQLQDERYDPMGNMQQ